MENVNFREISVKQLIYVLMECGFKKCELWKEGEYLKVHNKTKIFRSHLIKSRKIDLLMKKGLSQGQAIALVATEGQKVNKTNLSLMGTPIWSGSVEEFSNQTQFWDRQVLRCDIKGLFKRKLLIIILDEIN